MKWEDVWPLDFNPEIDEETRFLYNGKELHRGSGLYDYGFRYYLAEIGRFTGVDPLADAAPHLTPYRYGFNNPILFIDPDGLYETEKQANKAKSKVEKDLGAHNVGSISYDEDRNEYGFKVFKDPTIQMEDGVVTVIGDRGTSVFNKKDVHGFKSANGLHKASYWSLSASFVFGGGGSFAVGRVSDKYGESAWFSTIGGGVGLELGVGFDAGEILEHDQDFRVSDFQGFGIDWGAGVSIGPLDFGFRIGGNDPFHDQLLYKGDTYTTVSGAASSGPPKLLNALKFKIGGSFLWNETTTY